MSRAALYCRVSTTDQRDQGTSLETQRDQGLLRATALCWEVPQDNIIMEDWTGKDLHRPGLMRLLDIARSGQVKGVIIYTLDRLYRPENDGDEWRVFEVLQQFQDAGVEVAWVDPSIPTRGPLAAVFTFLDAWRAGRERRTMLERTTRGRLEKARRGKVISRQAAPYGYRFDPDTSTLFVVEEEASVVRLIFSLYTRERVSIVGLADRLNHLGFAPSRGGQRWHISVLGRMLRNETYCGTLWQNKWQGQGGKTSARSAQRSGLASSQRPRQEQIAVAVPAIVPRDLFEAAQRRLEENLRLAKRNARHQYLLTGLLKHSCGSRMGGRFSQGHLFYRCYRSHRHRAPIDGMGEPQPCPCHRVHGPSLEAAVWDAITGLLQQPDLLIQELERLAQPGSPTHEALEQEMAQVNKRLKELPQEEHRLVQGYRKGFYSDDMMREEMKRVHQEQGALEARRRELEGHLGCLDRAKSYKAQVQELARRLSQGLEHMDFPRRQELLRLLIDEVVYDAGQLTIKTVFPLGPASPQVGQLHPLSQRARVRVAKPARGICGAGTGRRWSPGA